MRRLAEPQLYPHTPFRPTPAVKTGQVHIVYVTCPFDWSVECPDLNERRQTKTRRRA